MHFNKKYPWDGGDVMSKFTGGEVWESETPHPPQTLAQTPETWGIFPLYVGLSVWWEFTTGLHNAALVAEMQNADVEYRWFSNQKCIYNRHLGIWPAGRICIRHLGFGVLSSRPHLHSTFRIRGEILWPASTFFILNIRQIQPMHLISTFLISDYFCIYILHSSFCRLLDADQGISCTYSMVFRILIDKSN